MEELAISEDTRERSVCAIHKWCIVLNHNTAERGIEHLRMAAGQKNFGVLVVDNGSPADDWDQLRRYAVCAGIPVRIADDDAGAVPWLEEGIASCHRAFLLRRTLNLGYSAGNNIGLRALLALCGEQLQVLIVNPDVAADTEAFGALLATKDAIVGPAVHEDYLGRVRDFESDIDFALGFRLGKRRPRCMSAVGPILSGCCLKLSGRALESFGLLPEDNFLYDEELYYFERVHRMGGMPTYEPSIVVHHMGSASTNKSSFAYFYYIFRNRVNYYLRIARVQYGGDIRFFLLLAQWSIGVSRRLLRTRNLDALKGVWIGIAHGARGRLGRYDGAPR
ncbi:MAG: glycosyltransferase family 2 protein [Anaerolineae bacterium]|nr:glycosyltransferase family 2 protein [Anaerolineae bacterium]